MKILFYTGGLNKGGAERVIVNLCNYLQEENSVSIMTDFNRKSEYDLNDEIKIYPLDKNDKIAFFKIFNNIKRLAKIYKTVKLLKPDVIISFLPTPSYRVLLLKKILKIPVISSVRNDPNQEYNSALKRKIAIYMYSKADGMIFQTEDARNWFPKRIANKSIVIPNPINPDFICKPYKKERENTVVTVGRLCNQKNQKLLIKAFSNVVKKHPKFILKIYGDGPLKDELKDYIHSLNLDQKVLLMGKTDNIKEAIYKAGLFVLSSDFEGMPNALMEAMALGLPCISTDCPIGGPKYLIQNKENGILVKVGNVPELVNAMNYLIDNQNEATKMGTMANKISDKINPISINKSWAEYIIKVYNNHGE